MINSSCLVSLFLSVKLFFFKWCYWLYTVGLGLYCLLVFSFNYLMFIISSSKFSRDTFALFFTFER